MKVSVLDHGYVELIEAWGTGKQIHQMGHDGSFDYEVGIIEAARQSTQGSFRGWDEDSGLLRTLFNHQHNQSTPFEAAGMTIEVHAPIFVFREWHRHRTQSYNEASARYKPLEAIYYHPDRDDVIERFLTAQNTKNRQAGSDVKASVTPGLIEDWREALADAYGAAEAFYRYSLDLGIPKELARLAMPVGHYSTMRATANLRNWLGFLTLRLDLKAQMEIRQFAHAVDRIVQTTFPHTWEIFNAARSEAP